MVTNYFRGVKSQEDLKRVYLRRCKLLHPDKGGNEKNFKEMFAQYQDWFTFFNVGTVARPQSEFWKGKKNNKKPFVKKRVRSSTKKKKIVKRVIRAALAKQGIRKKTIVKVKGAVYVVDFNEIFSNLVDRLF